MDVIFAYLDKFWILVLIVSHDACYHVFPSNISDKSQKYSCLVSPKNPNDEITTRPEMEMVWAVGGGPGGGYNSREIQRSREYRLVAHQHPSNVVT